MAAHPIDRLRALVVRPIVAHVITAPPPYTVIAPPRVVRARGAGRIVAFGRVTSETEAGPYAVTIGMRLEARGDLGEHGTSQVQFLWSQADGNQMRRGERWKLTLERAYDDDEEAT